MDTHRALLALPALLAWWAGLPGDLAGATAASEVAGKYYQAIRDPEPDLNLAPLSRVTVSSSQRRGGTPLGPTVLCDRRFGADSVWVADPAATGRPWVDLEFPRPQRLRAARLYWLPDRWGLRDRFPAFRLLAEQEDGTWRPVFSSLPADGTTSVNETIYAGRTVEFAPQVAKRWRFEAGREGAPFALREIEVFDEIPPFRTTDREPGDTRIRLRENQRPLSAVQRGATVLWATSAMEKVFRDDRLDPAGQFATGPLILRAARGETEAFQVVWTSPHGAAKVRAAVDGLKGPTPEAAHWAKVNPVAYVYCRVASTDLRMTVQSLDRFHGPGFYPEVLAADRPVSVLPGKHQPFWISVAVPRNALPGTYHGRVTVSSDTDTLALPFELQIRDFALPEPWDFSLRNVFTFSGYDAKLRSRHCPDETALQVYWRSVRRAAATMPGAAFSSLEPAPMRRDADDILSYDWAPFDRQVEWCRQELRVRHFILPFDYLAYHERLFSPPEIIGSGVAPGSERWYALLEQALSGYVAHLRSRGWLEEFSFFIYDEPDNPILPECRRLVALARRVEPALRLILHSHPWTPEMIALDATAVLNPRLYPLPFAQKLLERGWTLWTYCNGASLIDGPPNAGRMIPWTYFKQGVTGMTWHSLDDWGVTSPWEAPDRYLSWNASSCFFFPDPADPTQALRTIRWEHWRDGMEDFEYLRRLREGSRLSPSPELRAEAARLLERAAEFAGTYGYPDDLRDEQVFVATTRPRSALTPDQRSSLLPLRPRIEYEERPEVVETLRRQMGDLIERLNR